MNHEQLFNEIGLAPVQDELPGNIHVNVTQMKDTFSDLKDGGLTQVFAISSNLGESQSNFKTFKPTDKAEQPDDVEYSKNESDSKKVLLAEIEAQHEQLLQQVGLESKKELLRVTVEMDEEQNES